MVTRRIASILSLGSILALLGAACSIPVEVPLQPSAILTPTFTAANLIPTFPSATLTPTSTPATLTPSFPLWPTYTNTEYGYAIQYPPDLSLEEESNQIILSPDPDTPWYGRWYLRAERDFTPLGAQYFLDTPSNGQAITGQTTWTTYYLPEGYCDGPGCSPPMYALRVEFDDVLYTAFFYNQSSLTELQVQMLSTFRLLE